jgi:maltooligosyltrehalose trehalohydrolase
MNPRAYSWADSAWSGRPWNEAVLYELHIGAFTPEGTYRAAIGKLDHLADLGITAIELMGIGDFPGKRNWGYDSVLLYAPDSAYGRPDDLKALIDAAHAHGIMVIFDVVYNHLGREGNLIPKYWLRFLSPTHDTPWGKPPNFDAEGSGEVRDFIIHNALYWLEEFHGDGLRIDASHDMKDSSHHHILDELAERVRDFASVGSQGTARYIHLILEDEHNASARLMRKPDSRPTLYTAQWNHQMAHLRELIAEKPHVTGDMLDPKTETVARMTAIGYAGTAQASREADIIDCRVPPTAYISFLQTHDLVGNDLTGERIYTKAPLAPLRALSALYLLVPQIPMLFMGDEWGASTHFNFFCDLKGDIGKHIREGRLEFLKKELHVDDEALKRVPDPLAEETFVSSHLNWNELAEPIHADWLEWYRRILSTRRKHITPLLRSVCERCGTFEILGPRAFIAHWSLDQNAQLTLHANLSGDPATGFPPAAGQVIWLEGGEQSSGTLAPWTIRWIAS